MLRLRKVKRRCQANDTCYHLWGGGGVPLHGGEQRAQQCLPPAAQNVNLLRGLQGCQGHQERRDSHRHGREERFTQRSDRAESASVAGISPPGPQKDPFPSLPGGDTAVGLARRHIMHTLEQNKGAHTESRTGKDYPTRGGKSSIACKGSLSLGKGAPQA